MANRTADQTKPPTKPDEQAAKVRVQALDDSTWPAELTEADQPTAELAKTNGAPGVELQVADRQLVSDTAMLVRLVDQDRFDQLSAADRRCIGDLKDLTVKAVAERDGDGTRQLVSVDVVGQVLAAARQWAAARGLGGNGGGGSA